ncbi:MAG: methyl-accepting chemotaxis protein, partial [Acaryochloridaceae cyanobacterium CSU_5_19]|nr:methyl-accepting chemotaxis protein [Acaryochloridaceae cyanobacterium CSU_5_19]
QTAQHLEALQTFLKNVQKTVQPLDQPTQQLVELMSLMEHIVKQIQLQAMNAALEAARVGTAGQAFAEIAEKVHGFTRQLDSAITDIHPLITHIQGTAQIASAQISESQNSLLTPEILPLDTTREQLQNLASSHQRLFDLVHQITDTTSGQLEVTAFTEQLLTQLDTTTKTATTSSSKLAQTFQQLLSQLQTEQRIST